MRAACLALFLAACGPAPRPADPPPTTPPSIDDVAWIIGDWLVDDEGAAESWTRAPGVLWGIALSEGGFEVLTIDARGEGGELRLVPAPDGNRSDFFTADDRTASSITFRNPAHDDPTSIRYAHEPGHGPPPERLIATLDGPGGERTMPMTAIADAPPAPDEVLSAATSRILDWHTGAAAGGTPPPDDPGPDWSRRSLARGRHAATLTINGDASHVMIWRRADDGSWARIYEQRHPE